MATPAVSTPSVSTTSAVIIVGGCAVVGIGVIAYANYLLQQTTAVAPTAAPTATPGPAVPAIGTAPGTTPTQPDLASIAPTPTVAPVDPNVQLAADAISGATLGLVPPSLVTAIGSAIQNAPPVPPMAPMAPVAPVPPPKKVVTTSSCPSGWFAWNTGCRKEMDRGTHQGGCTRWTCPDGFQDNGSQCWKPAHGDWNDTRAPDRVVAGIPWCSGGFVPMDGTCKRYTVRPDEFRGRDCASYSQDQNNCPVGWLTDGGKCYVWQAATLTTTLV